MEFERAYTKETLLPNSSEMRLTEHQSDVPDLLPTQGNNVSSAGKDTQSSNNEQGSSVKNQETDAIPTDEEVGITQSNSVLQGEEVDNSRGDNESQEQGRTIEVGTQGEVENGFVHQGAQGGVDKQGNPINADGTLKVDKMNSINELTDADFENPTRNVELPAIPENVDKAIGANGKPVVIKKNIFERNKQRHNDITPEQSRDILSSALYTPTLYGQNQKNKRPKNWVVIKVKDNSGNNKVVLLEVDHHKDNVEIVHWHYLDDRGLEKIKRQASREDGQLLILPSESSEEVGALSNPTQGLSSDGKDKQSSATKQANEQKTAKSNAVSEDLFATAERVAVEDEAKRTRKKKEAKVDKRLVSDERMEELKKRLREKLRGQLNMGIDPELLAIGTEIAVGHIERGVSKFSEYAKTMIEDLGDTIRPYLKAFYNGARDMPELGELADQLTPYEEVRTFNVATIGKEGEQVKPTILQQAEQISNEHQVEQNTKEEAKQTSETTDVDNELYSITKQHNNKKDADIWVVRGKERVDKDVYMQRKQVAKEHNGYYSSFRGVNGFVFNSPEDAQAFADKVFNTENKGNYAQKSEEIMRTDNQGNPIDKDGKLIIEKVGSISDLTDEDFEHPTRSVELPTIPQNIDEAIGANGKPVVIKKNIFEKNKQSHNFSNRQSRDILTNALYNTDLVGQTQPTKRPKHWVAIQLDEKSPITVLEVNENKDNVEVVGWYTLDNRNLERIKRQAANEGGELLMLSSKDKVESLSTPNSILSSADKDTQSSATKQANEDKSTPTAKKTEERVSEYNEHVLFKYVGEREDRGNTYLYEDVLYNGKEIGLHVQQQRNDDKNPLAVLQDFHEVYLLEVPVSDYDPRGGNEKWTIGGKEIEDTSLGANHILFKNEEELIDFYEKNKYEIEERRKRADYYNNRGKATAKVEETHRKRNEIKNRIKKLLGGDKREDYEKADEGTKAEVDNLLAEYNGLADNISAEELLLANRYAIEMLNDESLGVREQGASLQNRIQVLYSLKHPHVLLPMTKAANDSKLARLQSTDESIEGISDEQGSALVELLSKNGLANSVSVEEHEDFLKELEDAQGERFSEETESANEHFNEQLTAFEKGKLPQNKTLAFGTPSAILCAAGVENKPIGITQATLRKHLKKHGLTTNDIRDLVKAMAKPLMVYTWGEKAKNHIIITNITTQDGRKITTAIRFENKGSISEINEMASVHGKALERLAHEMNTDKTDFGKDNLKYVDKEKALDWLSMETPLVSRQAKQELVSAAKIVENFENPKVEDEKKRYQVVYHGSGAEFSEFDHSHMGEGEGGQAHGWGTYVAVDKNVSNRYANSIAQEATYQGKTSNDWLSKKSRKGEIIGDILGMINSRGDHNSLEEVISDYRKMMSGYKVEDVLNKLNIDEFSKKRNLYTVDIPDNNGSNYLEEDGSPENAYKALESYKEKLGNKPFVQEYIKLKEELLEAYGRFEDKIDSEETYLEKADILCARIKELENNKEAYKNIEKYLNISSIWSNHRAESGEELLSIIETICTKNPAKEASQLLHRAGLVGIHYNGMRDGECYVIFDDKDLKITHHERFMKTNDGVVYGYVDSKGNVHLDRSLMNGNTPIHEFGHLWNDWCKENNAELWGRGVELIKDSRYYEEVKRESQNKDSAYFGMNEAQIVDEAMARAIGDKGEELLKQHDITKFAEFKSWLAELWHDLKKKFGVGYNENLEDMTLDEFTEIANRDLLGGEKLNNDSMTDEQRTIVEQAKENGTYMKAPNGKPTKLTEKQWVQVRTKAFKEWFGDWEKAARIEKLKQSKILNISGTEITPSDDLKQYKKNALEYGKSLRGEYTNKDSKVTIFLTGGNSRGGLREILQHDYKDIEHLQSIAAIPQIIENADSKSKCNKRVPLAERCRRSRSVARGCLHLSAREKTTSNTNKKILVSAKNNSSV